MRQVLSESSSPVTHVRPSFDDAPRVERGWADFLRRHGSRFSAVYPPSLSYRLRLGFYHQRVAPPLSCFEKKLSNSAETPIIDVCWPGNLQHISAYYSTACGIKAPIHDTPDNSTSVLARGVSSDSPSIGEQNGADRQELP